MAAEGKSKEPFTDDAALGGRLTLRQPARGHRFGHDAILLAAATPAAAGEVAVDLGAGVGTKVIAYPANDAGGSENQRWELVPVGGNVYQIRSALTGFALTISSSREPGTPIVCYPPAQTTNQQWALIPADGNYFLLKSRHNGFVLDVEGGNRAPGTTIIGWPQQGSENQQWELVPVR